MGVVTGILAVAAAMMAITGFCPSDWLASRSQPAQSDEVLGVPVVRSLVSLEPGNDD